MTSAEGRPALPAEVSPRPETPGAVQRFRYPSDPLGYRPALDGLRTIAVTLVLFFHADFGWASGGFLGVSVFFTLSGFLITALLLREWWDGDSLDGRRFWARRFRRLTPAAWVTVAAVLVLGLVGVWSDDQVRDLGPDVPWALFDLLNWHFIVGGTSYADTFGAPSPLEHFWSLAVEAQFYAALFVLVAVVLTVGRRRSPLRRLGHLQLALGLATVASVAVCWFTARHSLDRAYFGTDSRAAEMLFGAMLAVATRRRLRVHNDTVRRWLVAVGAAALVVIVVLSVTVTTTSPWLYPWGLLLTAACSTALLAGLLQGGALTRLIGHPTMAAVGRASYAVYLVHWPIFLWLDETRVGADGWPLFALRLAVVGAATLALNRLVERPLRLRTWAPRPAMAGISAALVVVLMTNAVLSSTAPPVPDHLRVQDPGELVITEAHPRPTTTLSPPTSADTTAETTTSTTGPPPEPTAPEPDPVPPATEAPPPPPEPRRPRSVLLIGDSIAKSIEPALATALAQRGASFTSAAIPGCGILEGAPPQEVSDELGADLSRCPEVAARRQARAIELLEPDLVVSLSSWEAIDRVIDGHRYRFGTPEADQMLIAEFGRTRDRLTAFGAQYAWVLTPDPVQGAPPLRTSEEQGRIQHLRGVIRAVIGTSAADHEIDLQAILCPSTPCPRAVNGVEFRPTDGAHFDDPDANALLAAALAEEIMQIDLDRPPRR